MKMARDLGRQSRPDLVPLGCGEPESVKFCQKLGLDSTSNTPGAITSTIVPT